MYSILDYGDMILDCGRTEAYAQALQSRINSDSVVLDIGAGPGILTLIACQAGARKVYAVESAAVIEVAREAIAASGFADRVELIQAHSSEISLPEKMDVIVGDLHGVLPLHAGSIGSILDARDRFLRPGGFLIPERETLWMAVVSAPEFHKKIVNPWKSSSGIDYQGANKRAVNSWRKWRFGREALVVDPREVVVLDYSQLASANAKGNAAWPILQGGEAHGFCMWFDCTTAPGCGFSNSPASGEEHVYGQAFFPWPDGCRLEPGDEVSVEIRADEAGPEYIWSWKTEIRDSQNPSHAKAAFRQSTFLSAPLSKEWYRKSGSTFVPSPNTDAAIDTMILQLFSSGINLEEISHQVTDRFPERFPEWQKALTRVGEMSLHYSL